MAHPNEDLLRNVYAAFARGDLAGLLELFSEDFQWHMAGQFALAGEYKGVDEVKGLFQKLFELLGADGFLQLEPEGFFAKDEYVLSLVRYNGRRGDNVLDMRNVHVWRVSESKVSEYWFHPEDLHAVERFWS